MRRHTNLTVYAQVLLVTGGDYSVVTLSTTEVEKVSQSNEILRGYACYEEHKKSFAIPAVRTFFFATALKRFAPAAEQHKNLCYC